MVELKFRNEDLVSMMSTCSGKGWKLSYGAAAGRWMEQNGVKEWTGEHWEKLTDFFTDEPTLWLVKDKGIYLMPSDDGKTTPAYAVGYNPEKNGDVYDRCRAAVGSDDFCESFPLKEVSRIIASGSDLIIRFDENTLEVIEEMIFNRN